MFIIRSYRDCAIGDSLEEAIKNFEETIGDTFNPEDHYIYIYEAKEIKVQRKFEVIKED